jgi:uncharacterized protein
VSGKTSFPEIRARDELLSVYVAADALMAGLTCVCTDAGERSQATCCHFGEIGREPYVTALEMAVVERAVAARGGFPRRGRQARRSLPIAEDPRTCPLLSPAGRCTIYEARPLGCRTFFCEGRGLTSSSRKELLAMSRRVADVSAGAFPRADGPRPFLRALEDLRRSGRA